MAEANSAEQAASSERGLRVSLIVKWSAKYGADTVDQHRAVAEQSGSVWWGLHGTPGRPKLSSRWLEQINAQLAAGQPTSIFLSGPTCWRTRLIAIALSRSEVDASLIPSYYPLDQQHGLWVQISDFKELERAWLTTHLELASAPGVPLSKCALSNQTNPLIVREPASPDMPVQARPVMTHETLPPGASGQRVWWVCQGATYGAARDSGTLWAPKVGKDGAGRAFWRALQEANVGDIVIHYSNGRIRATSTITHRAVDAPRPIPQTGAWTGEGWLVRTSYRELADSLALDQIPANWRVAEQGPFTKQGAVRQGYFYPLSRRFVDKLAVRFPQLGLAAADWPEAEVSYEDYLEPTFPTITAAISEAKLRLDEQAVRRYHVSLKTRGFVVLSGLSGSGKTWLAQLYADAVGARSLLVAVAPNWTTNEDLLGYYDPLAKEYRHTPFSLFLTKAAAAWTWAQQHGTRAQPFHLILDEMNLARVEYYFAKFLSAMEVRAREGSATLELDSRLTTQLTPNLYFIGTVNVDETTHGFADKIYDRAQLIEIPVTLADIQTHLAGREYASDLEAVWTTMSSTAPFAYRVLDEIHSYVEQGAILKVPTETALDEQLLQKVLPKVKGTEISIGPVLEAFIALAANRWPLSRAKAQDMLAAFEAHGFTSYF
jgi:hypothetical protein